MPVLFPDYDIPDYDNRNMDYYHTYHPGDPLRDIYTVNEHLAVLLSVVLNTLVLLVFIRVLGLARLPSRLIVSLAAVNLVSSLSLALHTTAVTTKYFSSSENMCRFVTGLLYECDILFYYAHCGAIVERMVACNMPGFYSRALHIVGPAVIVSPWAVWILNIILMNAGVYDCRASMVLIALVMDECRASMVSIALVMAKLERIRCTASAMSVALVIAYLKRLRC
ncbi:hypothetical protein RRG08_045098 [Elysia crispata]|uniref:G-protein coupled receptors family 1 profile domain-containing protein n=1 Tax=Elysia crispata TaxID=231223 RepID=A0AAE1D419_9GAST|nr:hypothetical protein RRG08_045098 [Elysia crispata]